MPPRTRNQGAPPGGHLQVETLKPRTPLKRSRDDPDDSNDEPTSKRVQSERIARFPFNSTDNPSFRHTLNHSARRSIARAPLTPSGTISRPTRLAHSARLPSKYLADSSYDLPALKPTGVRKNAKHNMPGNTPEEQKPSRDTSPPTQPQTPPGQENTTGWWGSIRRIFSRVPVAAEAAESQSSQFVTTNSREDSGKGAQENSPEPGRGNSTPSAGSTSRPRVTLFDSPPRSNARHRKSPNFSRRRRQQLNDLTFSPPDQTAQMAGESPPEFATATIPGSNKRKMNTEDMEAYESRNPGFGLDYNDPVDDVSGNDVIAEDTVLPVTPLAKKQKQILASPLKSALKSGNRSTKRARIDEKSPTSKVIYGVYGRAGEYKGSTFVDPLQENTFSTLADESISLEGKSAKSPATINDTKLNGKDGSAVRQTIFDEQAKDDGWRPTAANPRRNHFCVPDFFDPEPDESEDDASETSFEGATTTSPPSTPRMAHAELPNTTPTTNANSAIFNDDSTVKESTELKLSKARLEAQKYQPKNSSRLSSVTQARSRSSSPPASTREDSEDLQNLLDSDKENQVAKKPLQEPKILDNTVRREDGMTDYEREHQFDSWAQSLDWPEPQTYEDAGVVSPFISDLLRRRRNAEDEQRAHEFWQKEFDAVDREMETAKTRGLRLELIAGDD